MTNSKLLALYGILWFLLTIVFFSLACNKNEIDLDPEQDNNPISNATFESPINFDASTVWQKYVWETSGVSFEWIKGKGYNESNCISLSCENTLNDVALMQDIQLEGGHIYSLNAWIKTENVVGDRGANICLFGTWQSSDPLIGTDGWKKVSLVFIAPETGKVTIACRLGFWGGTASGKAWFDNLEVQEVDMFKQESQHIQLFLEQEDASAVLPATIDNWLSNLDKAYEKYYELIGQYPYDGKIITIFSTKTYPGGWAVAGNPILWHQPYVKPTLLNIENRGDWSFGILHEIGHDFAANIGIEGNGNWDWNEEMFANLRMYYVVEMLNASVVLLKSSIYR